MEPKVTSTDYDLREKGKKQAIVYAWQQLYLADIRRNPDSYMGAAYATQMLELMGKDQMDKEVKSSPVLLLTINPCAVEPELAIAYFKSVTKRIRGWCWVKAYAYGVETKNDRPHLHMVIHCSKRKFPGDVRAQVWNMHKDEFHMRSFPSLLGHGHNIKHVDVRSLLTKRDIKNAVNYIYKGWEDGTLLDWDETGESDLLWPPEKSKEKTLKIEIIE